MSDLRAVEQFKSDLDAAAERQRERRTRRLKVGVGTIVSALIAGAAATAATGTFPIGAPFGSDEVTAPPSRPVPSTERLSRSTAADPAGGPRWGIRTFRTVDGSVCHQVGRIVDGRLGLIDDNRRFRELPPTTDANSCLKLNAASGATGTDRAGLTGAFGQQEFTASGAPPGSYAPDACTTVFDSLKAASRADATICDAYDPRYVTAGTTGPNATEVRIVAEGMPVVKVPVIDGRFIAVSDRSAASGKIYALLKNGTRGTGRIVWGGALPATDGRRAIAPRVSAPGRQPITAQQPVDLAFDFPAGFTPGGTITLQLAGPANCPRHERVVARFGDTGARPQRRLYLRLRPPAPRASAPRTWCSGRYSGSVTYALLGAPAADAGSFEFTSTR